MFACCPDHLVSPRRCQIHRSSQLGRFHWHSRIPKVSLPGCGSSDDGRNVLSCVGHFSYLFCCFICGSDEMKTMSFLHFSDSLEGCLSSPSIGSAAVPSPTPSALPSPPLLTSQLLSSTLLTSLPSLNPVPPHSLSQRHLPSHSSASPELRHPRPDPRSPVFWFDTRLSISKMADSLLQNQTLRCGSDDAESEVNKPFFCPMRPLYPSAMLGSFGFNLVFVFFFCACLGLF